MNLEYQYWEKCGIGKGGGWRFEGLHRMSAGISSGYLLNSV